MKAVVSLKEAILKNEVHWIEPIYKEWREIAMFILDGAEIFEYKNDLRSEWNEEIEENTILMNEMGIFHLPAQKSVFVTHEVSGFAYAEVMPVGTKMTKIYMAFETGSNIAFTAFQYDSHHECWAVCPAIFDMSLETLRQTKDIRSSINCSDDGWQRYGGNVHGSLSVINLLNTKGTEVKHVPAPEKLNKRRQQRGKLPLVSYSTVTIGGAKYTNTGSGDGSRQSPRMHFRRGHIRFKDQPQDKWVWVKPTIVGHADQGKIIHEGYKV